jgi:hypothetical protein
MAEPTVAAASLTFDHVAAVGAGLYIVGFTSFLLVRGTEIAGPRLFFALRVMLGLAAAIFGATIPGFLEIGWTSGQDLSIRAGGALAVFVLIFLFTPSDPAAAKTTISAPNGVAAGEIKGGTFNISPPASDKARKPRPAAK